MSATAGWPVSVPAFVAATWAGRRPADSFNPEGVSYPGLRPTGSYVVEGEWVWGLDPGDGGWVDRESDETVDLGQRRLVLAYGSNADPGKLTGELTTRVGGAVFVLRCVVLHHAAVWCDARRGTDASVVATIQPDPGRVEVHHVLAVTAAQLQRVDEWEGAPTWYERRSIAGSVVLETGEVPADVMVYVGTTAKRPPLLVDGHMLRISEHTYVDVDRRVPR